MTNLAVMDAALQALLDKEAIRAIIYTYCKGVDTKDWDMVRSCFAAGAGHHHGPFNGDTEEFIAFASGVLNSMDGTSHVIGNILIDVDGDTARSEASFVAYHRICKDVKPDFPLPAPDADTDWILVGRYVDTWQRSNGAWAITSRTGAQDWSRTQIAGPKTVS